MAMMQCSHLCQGIERDQNPGEGALLNCLSERLESRLARPRGGGIGRRSGLKIRWPQGRAGSSPAPGIKKNKDIENSYLWSAKIRSVLVKSVVTVC